MDNRWTEYQRWDAAFRDLVFGGQWAYEPVYLDVEDELLVRVADRAQGKVMSPSDAEASLASAVRKTLCVGPQWSGYGALSAHRDRLYAWESSRQHSGGREAEAPPVIALLAVFARAAELMGRDENYSSAAYYPRLNGLLSLTGDDAQKMQAAFRNESERLWQSLNDWLEDMGGAFGEATATTIGHRYVGIPMSQALIREADRQLLTEFFESMSLEPGLRLGAPRMNEYLTSWFARGRGSSSMRSMWKSKVGKEILAETAAQALVQWDGSIEDRGIGARRLRPPVLTASITRGAGGLGKSRLRLGFAVGGALVGTRAISRTWEIRSAPGDPKPLVDLFSLTDRFAAPTEDLEVDPASLVTGKLRLRAAADDVQSQEIERRPQPVVVFTLAEEAGLYIEVERVRLGEPHLLIVNTSARKPNGEARFQLDELLHEIAQPGFTRMDDIGGIPVGWTLYRNVVVLSTHDRPEIALDPLRPSQTSVLNASGGFRMPGHAQRWSSLVPLSLRGVVQDAESVELTLCRIVDGERRPEHRWTSSGSEIVASTDGLTLPDGPYRLLLTATSSPGTTITELSSSFALCSSHSERFGTGDQAMAYTRPNDATLPGEVSAAVLSAGGPGQTMGQRDEDLLAIGASTYAPALELDATKPAPDDVWWSTSPLGLNRAVLAEPAAPDSCAITGSHHEFIETHRPGAKLDRAECTGCGRVRWYPAKGKPKVTVAITRERTRPALDRLGAATERSPIKGAQLLDALVWLGGGTPHELAHLVRQIDDTALGVDEIVRALESLGHIDVVRSPKDLAVQAWRMAPRTFSQAECGDWVLTGSWDRASLEDLPLASCERGGELSEDDQDWLPTRRLRGLSGPDVHAIADRFRAVVVPQAGVRMLSALRPIRTVVAALPRTSISVTQEAEWFNVSSATWVRVETITQPGAYRVRRGYTSSYIYRDSEDVIRGDAVRVTAQLAKHAAATRPMVGYDRLSETIFAPLGAELPGLYGRALALMSGRPPAKLDNRPLLAYRNVPADAAARLAALLKG